MGMKNNNNQQQQQQQNANGNFNNSPPNNSTSGMEKFVYFGAGVVVGVAMYPFFKKGIDWAKPMMKDLFDQVLSKTENVIESTSDIYAKARRDYQKEKPKKQQPRKHDHDHDHD